MYLYASNNTVQLPKERWTNLSLNKIEDETVKDEPEIQHKTIKQ